MTCVITRVTSNDYSKNNILCNYVHNYLDDGLILHTWNNIVCTNYFKINIDNIKKKEILCFIKKIFFFLSNYCIRLSNWLKGELWKFPTRNSYASTSQRHSFPRNIRFPRGSSSICTHESESIPFHPLTNVAVVSKESSVARECGHLVSCIHQSNLVGCRVEVEDRSRASCVDMMKWRESLNFRKRKSICSTFVLFSKREEE